MVIYRNSHRSKEINQGVQRGTRRTFQFFFLLSFTDQNKQCTENQFTCLTTVYKGIKKRNMFHSYQNENKLHVNEYEKENAVKHRKAYSDVLVNAIVKLQ